MPHANGASALFFAFDSTGKPVSTPAFIVQDPILEMTLHTNTECPIEVKYDSGNPHFSEIYGRHYIAKTGYKYCYQVRGYATTVQELASKFFDFAKEAAAQVEREAHELGRLEEMQAEGYAAASV